MSEDLFDEPEPRSPEVHIKRDRWGRYLIPDPTDNLREKPWTRATTMAKTMMDNFVLHQWQQRMVAKGLTMRPDLYALAAATSLDDRDTLNQVCEDAKTHAGSKDRANLGIALHGFTEQHDRYLASPDRVPGTTSGVGVPEGLRPDFDAYTALVADLGIQFVEIERVVIVPAVGRDGNVGGVGGTFDRLGQMVRPMTVDVPELGPVTLAKGSYVIVDLKTGRELTYGFNEIAIQLALYANALAMWRVGTKKFDRMPCINKLVALVIHLPVGEAKATLYAINIKAGWEAAQLCSQVRDWRRVRNLAVPIEVASSVVPASDPAIVHTHEEDPGGYGPYEFDDSPQQDMCHGCGEQLNPDQSCSHCDDPAKQECRNPECSHDSTWCPRYESPSDDAPCGAILELDSMHQPMCEIKGPHDQHEADGYTWRTEPQPGARPAHLDPLPDPTADGMRCIQCQRVAKNGKLTHVRGCPSGVKPGRKPSKTPAVVVPDELLQPARPDPVSVVREAQRAAEVMQAVQEAVEIRPPTWEERISQASSSSELSAIYRQASAVGQWNARLMKLATAQRSKFDTA